MTAFRLPLVYIYIHMYIFIYLGDFALEFHYSMIVESLNNETYHCEVNERNVRTILLAYLYLRARKI